MALFDEIISRMIKSVGAKNQQEMLEIMGFSGGLASKWKKRGKVPDGSIAKVAEMTGVTIKWLKIGEGPMQSRAAPAPLPDIKDEKLMVAESTGPPFGITDEEWQLICNYRCASDEMRKACFGNLEMSAKESRGKDGGGSNSKEMKSA